MYILNYVVAAAIVTALAVLLIKAHRTKKEIAVLRQNEKTLQSNMQNLYTNITLLSANVSKALSYTERQSSGITRIEQLMITKVSPLLEKNAVIDDLKRRLREEEQTTYSLRSTILQMTATLKKLQKKEKEERTAIRGTQRKRKQQVNQ